MKFERFEDILAWQKARVIVNKVYGVTKGCKDWGFNDQIQRAAVSIMNNIAEGMRRRAMRTFHGFSLFQKAPVVKFALCSMWH